MIKKLSYAIEYGEFWGLNEQEYNYWQSTRKILSERIKIMKERKIKKIETSLDLTKKQLWGQLWEECRCGHSPIYMSHNCCEKCASKQ
jgi:uncharacterized protein (DUF111 family)